VGIVNKTYIIAEAGVNHNGSIEMAKQLIDVAAESGADAVKFQTFSADKIVGKSTPKAEYQKETTDAIESQYAMLKKLELSKQDHITLMDYCKDKKVEFLSTPFDIESFTLLSKEFNLSTLKISSGDLTNALLLLKTAQAEKNIILSTGMSTIGEIEMALSLLAFGYVEKHKTPSSQDIKNIFSNAEAIEILKKRVKLLHCTSEYPAPFLEVNLRAMDTLKSVFGLNVGLSDHTTGISIPIAAVARGASIIEKHFTIDRNLPGPDHKASLEPQELQAMVRSIREVEMAMGSSIKSPSPSEFKNMAVSRKSLVAKKDIKEGDFFSEQNLTVKRPGNGISSFYFWDLIGQKANTTYKKDDVIKWKTNL
jgi:N-acetylneuraminate synthase